MRKKLLNNYYHTHKRVRHHAIVVAMGLVLCTVAFGNSIMGDVKTHAQFDGTGEQLSGSGGQWNMQEMFSSLTVRLSNSGAIGSGGNMTLTLQNDRPNNILGVRGFGVGMASDKFGTTDTTLLENSFTGALLGKTCSSIERETHYDFKILKCILVTGFNFNQNNTLMLTLSGIVNPSIAGRTFINLVLMTTTMDEFFMQDILIKDPSDSTGPSINSVIVKNQQELIVEFSEPIYMSSNPNETPFQITLSGLNMFGFWVDWETSTRLTINTTNQQAGQSYSFSFSGVRDFNGNPANVLSGTFSGFDTSGPHIEYMIPYSLPQGETSYRIDIYSENNMFEGVGSIATGSVNLGSGITLSGSVTIDNNDHIWFLVNINDLATMGSRDITLSNIGGQSYSLYGGAFVEKNFDNFIKMWGNFTKNYDAIGHTGSLLMDFETAISTELTTGNFSIEKIYGESVLTPVLTTITKINSGTTLQLNFTNIEEGSFYNLSFVGTITGANGKSIDTFMKVGFDFFNSNGGNFFNKIASPMVIDSKPFDWSWDIPIDGGFNIEVWFDQALQEQTVENSTNVQLKDDLGNVVNTTLDYTGVDNQYKLTVTPSSSLSYNTNYKLVLSNTIKSDKGLGLVGNIPPSEGNGHKINFTTTPDYATMGTTTFYVGEDFHVMDTNPFPGEFNFPIDGKLKINFDDIIDTSTVTSNNITLYALNNGGDEVGLNLFSTATVSYNDTYSPKVIYIDPASNLTSNTRYKLEIKSGLKSKKGLFNSRNFVTEFTVGEGLAANKPFTIAWDYNEPDISRIEIGFGAPIQASLVTNQNVTMYDSNGTKISLNVMYNDEGNSIVVKPTTKLNSSESYQLFLTNSIVSIYGASINTGNLQNGFAIGESNSVVKTYQVNGSYQDMDLFMQDFFVKSDKVEMRFSKDIVDPKNKANYILLYCQNFNPSGITTPENCGAGYQNISLANAILKYDSDNYKLSIEGLSIPGSTAGETIVEVRLGSIESTVGDTLATCSQQSNNYINGKGCIGVNLFHIPVFSEEVKNYFAGGNFAMQMHASIHPQNNMASKKTMYFIDFPVSHQLTSGDTVEINFPNQFTLTSATLDSNSPLNYVNGNFTTPKFTVAVDAAKNILIYTITQAYADILNENDFIMSDILGITNPSQSRDNYIVEITTKNSRGLPLDKFNSEPIFIKATSIGTSAKVLTIQLRDKTNINLEVENVLIHLHSFGGHEELYTNASGSVSFTGQLNEKYGIFIDPFVMTGDGNGHYYPTNYMTDGKFKEIFLNDNKTINFEIKDQTDTDEFLTVSGTIIGLNTKKVTVWLASPMGYFEKDLGTLNSNSYDYAINVPKNIGFSQLGIMPTMPKDYATTTAFIPDWQQPWALDVLIEGSGISNKNFTISIPTIQFAIKVQDTSGQALANANVYAYSPSGNGFGLNGKTNANGVAEFMVKEGIYLYGASVEGLPPISEKTINITANVTGTLTVTVPTLTIKGQVVLSDNSPVSNAGIFGFNNVNGNSVFSQTDNDGKYTLYVDANTTWNVGGYSNTYGPLSEQTIAVGTSSLVGKNFVVNVDNLFSVTGKVELGGSGMEGVNVFAVPTDGDFKKGGYAFTDNNGTFTIKLTAGTYDIKTFHPAYGEIGTKNAQVISANTSIGTFSMATPKSVTIVFTGEGLPTDTTSLEWSLDVDDTTNNIGFHKKIQGLTQYTFNNVIPGTYNVKVFIPGLGEVYNSGAYVVSADKTTTITLGDTNAMLAITGVVKNSFGTAIDDAFVEIKGSGNNFMIGTKVGSGGIFELFVKPGTYTLIAKKPGYEPSNETALTAISGDINVGTITIVAISNTVNVYGRIVNGSGTAVNNAFINIQGITTSGDFTNFWIGESVSTSGYFSIAIPNGKRARIIVTADGYAEYSAELGVVSDNNNAGTIAILARSGYTIKETKYNSFVPSQGGIVDDKDSGITVTIPNNALGNGQEAGQITTKESTQAPQIAGFKTAGGKVKKLDATDSNGNPITSFNSEIGLDFDYTAYDIYSTNTGITVEDIRNLQISYYDDTLSAWVGLSTTLSVTGLTYSGSSDFDTYTGSLLLSAITGGTGTTAIFTFKSTTIHFSTYGLPIASANNSSNGGGGAVGGGNIVGGGGGGGGGGIAINVSTGNVLGSGTLGSGNIIQKHNSETNKILIDRPDEFAQVVAQVTKSMKNKFGNELVQAYVFAKDIGITTTSTIDKAAMDGPLIREHAAKMMVNYAVKILGIKPDLTRTGCEYADMANASFEMRSYARLACQLGIMGVESDVAKTPAKKFNGKGTVTRSEFGTMLSRTIYIKDPVEVNSCRYCAHLERLKADGIMTKIDVPARKEIRAYVRLMMMRTYQNLLSK